MENKYIIPSRVSFEESIKNKKERKKSVISPFAAVCLIMFFSVLILYVISCFSVSFADLINESVSAYYRMVMASLTSSLPFSLFEIVIMLLPLAVVTIIVLAVRRFSSGKGRARFLVNLVSLILVIYSGHLLALGIGYKTTPLSSKLEIGYVTVTEDRLAEVMTALRDEVNELSDCVPRDANGVSDPDYSMEKISSLICDAYESFASEYGFPLVFNSNAKPVYFSDVMSYLTISGIYTYYTGEANVNMLYPAYDRVFATAHELSHQRGILRENEANFMAYLVCRNSSDPYLRYSAALTMYGYVSSALYRTNKARYNEIAAGLDKNARLDVIASNDVYYEYSDTILADISNLVNDLFLKSSGTEGVVSYGLVVRLTLAYYESQK